MVMPMIGMVIQCHGWLMPGSVSFGRTSQPQVSLASAASSVRATHSSVSNARRGAARIAVPAAGLEAALHLPGAHDHVVAALDRDALRLGSLVEIRAGDA